TEAAILLGDAVQRGGEHHHLTDERLVHHLQFHAVDELGEPDRVTGEAARDAIEHLPRRGVDEQGGGSVGELVSDGAGNGPTLRQGLAMLEDLLRQYVEGPSLPVASDGL